MAASEYIGNVTTMYLKTTTPLAEEIQTNISKGLVVNGAVTYGQLETAARQLNQLTTNTYEDTICITEISVAEKVSE